MRPGDEFSARLVSPDEFLSRKPNHPPVQKILPLPSLPLTPIPAPVPTPLIEHKENARTDKNVVREKPDEKAAMIHPSAPPPQSQKPAAEERRSERQVLPPVPPVAVNPDQVKKQSGPSIAQGGQRNIIREPSERSDHTGNVETPDHLQPSFREKIFDRSVIRDLAKRDSEKEEKENRGKDKAFSFDTDEFKFLIYNRRLKERIENIWVYPPEAAAKGIYGDLIIRFTIKKNGQLGSVELVRTSGHKNLDDAAMKALKDGAPYWPLPKEWNLEGYTIEGHFIYTIYGYYIR